MTPEQAEWLRGQITAIRVLSTAIADTVQHHCPDAARELSGVQYACNRAESAIMEAARKEPA